MELTVAFVPRSSCSRKWRRQASSACTACRRGRGSNRTKSRRTRCPWPGSTAVREIAGERHRFRAVMLPINAARIDAPCGQKQNDRFDALLRAAAERGLTVTAASALNGGRLARGSSTAVLSTLTPAQAALQSVLRIPGITVALVGMKTSAHIDENLQLAFGGDAMACVGGQSEVM